MLQTTSFYTLELWLWVEFSSNWQFTISHFSFSFRQPCFSFVLFFWSRLPPHHRDQLLQSGTPRKISFVDVWSVWFGIENCLITWRNFISFRNYGEIVEQRNLGDIYFDLNCNASVVVWCINVSFRICNLCNERIRLRNRIVFVCFSIPLCEILDSNLHLANTKGE